MWSRCKENFDKEYLDGIKAELVDFLNKHGMIKHIGSTEIFIKTNDGGLLELRINDITVIK
jgi:hypothetical protein